MWVGSPDSRLGREFQQPIGSGGMRPIIAPSGSCACEFRGGNGHVKSHVRTGGRAATGDTAMPRGALCAVRGGLLRHCLSGETMIDAGRFRVGKVCHIEKGDGRSGADFIDHLDEAGSVFGIQILTRLVEHEQRRFFDERPREQDEALFASGKNTKRMVDLREKMKLFQ